MINPTSSRARSRRRRAGYRRSATRAPVYDADGNPMATTFMDYLLPNATEVPVIEYGTSKAESGRVLQGVGEGGAIGAPPAVVNAIAMRWPLRREDNPPAPRPGQILGLLG